MLVDIEGNVWPEAGKRTFRLIAWETVLRKVSLLVTVDIAEMRAREGDEALADCEMEAVIREWAEEAYQDGEFDFECTLDESIRDRDLVEIQGLPPLEELSRIEADE